MRNRGKMRSCRPTYRISSPIELPYLQSATYRISSPIECIVFVSFVLEFGYRLQAYMVRKMATHTIPPQGYRFFICSLSTETIVYKVSNPPIPERSHRHPLPLLTLLTLSPPPLLHSPDTQTTTPSPHLHSPNTPTTTPSPSFTPPTLSQPPPCVL